MIKIKKGAVAFVAAMLAVCSIVLTGCQENLAPADQVISSLYDLVVKDDAATVTALLGFDSEEGARTSLMEDGSATMMDVFMTSFEGVEFEEDEIKEMSATMDGLVAKLSCTAEITEQSGKETTVVLKAKGFSQDELMKIMEEVQTEMMSNMDEETLAALASYDEAATQQVMKDVVKACIVKLDSLEPVDEEREITVKCEKLRVEVNGKEKIAWMPADVAKFSTDAEATIFK